MRLKEMSNQLLPRKIMAASITGTIYGILFGLFFGAEFSPSGGGYFRAFVTSVPFYMMYSFPVILIYGTGTSLISDLISGVIEKTRREITREIITLALHILFGLILSWVSLSAAILFFWIDRLIKYKSSATISWKKSLKSLFIALIIFLIFMFAVYIIDLMDTGMGDYLQ